MSNVPLFWESEVLCGKVLGTGSYCEVLAVNDIILSSSADTGQSSDPQRQLLAQKFAAMRSRGDRASSKQEGAQLAIYGKPTGPPKEIDDPETEAAPKLALKRVRSEELPSAQLQTAKEDFQRELEILLELMKPSDDSNSQSSSLPPLSPQHPNIIELYGIGFGVPYNSRSSDSKTLPAISLFNSDLQPSFLLLNQIRSTLSNRLVRWRNDKGMGIYETLSLDNTSRRNHWVERLLVISKVAHAIQHLHSHRILYRDIKPANIGFDALDVPKLFDFGLAKRISQDMRYRKKSGRVDDQDQLEDGLFHLTPETGTLRYMAMEVGKGRPYGWSSDVYSLAILMHEVLSLKVPFGCVAPREFRKVIWNQGQGLPMDSSWPNTIQDLLPKMWNSDPTKRPAINEVVMSLDDMLRGPDQDLFPKAIVSRGRRFSLF